MKTVIFLGIYRITYDCNMKIQVPETCVVIKG